MNEFNYHSLAIVVAALLVAALVTMVTMPLVRLLAVKLGAIDMPGIKGTDSERHLHTNPTPRMGGLAIFLGFCTAFAMFLHLNQRLTAMMIGALIIVIVGMIDDCRGLSAGIKFIFQIIAATIAVMGGSVIRYFGVPSFISETGHFNLGILAVPVSVFWIVLITNAVNLIDGLDGLAAGVSAISSVCLVIISLGYSDMTVAVLCAALAGGCIGFLPFNVSPARIFMGDTGATFIGFILAVASIQGLFKMYALISFAVPFCTLGLPIFDVCFAVISRVSHGENPMKADRKHVHYRLMDMGLTKQQTVAVLYIISALLGVSAVLLSTSDSGRFLPLILAFALLGWTAYTFYRNRKAYLKGDFRPNRGGKAPDVRIPSQKRDEDGHQS